MRSVHIFIILLEKQSIRLSCSIRKFLYSRLKLKMLLRRPRPYVLADVHGGALLYLFYFK